MLATKRILILSAVLLTVPPARADINTFADPLFLVAPELPHDALLHFEDLGTGWIEPGVRRIGFEFLFKSEIQDAQGKNARLAVDPLVWLHWDVTGQRPSLAYQITDNGVMHLRGSRRGALINVTWSY
jgi:hypothetical protein